MDDIGLTFLGILMFLTSVFMMLLILVQRGKGGGLTGALGGMGGQSAFGSKAGDVFTRITVGTAVVWIMLCMLTIAVFNPPPRNSLGAAPDKPSSTMSGTDEESEDSMSGGMSADGIEGAEGSDSSADGVEPGISDSIGDTEAELDKLIDDSEAELTPDTTSSSDDASAPALEEATEGGSDTTGPGLESTPEGDFELEIENTEGGDAADDNN